MRILCVDVFNPKLINYASPYCGGEVFAKGLEMNGHEVHRFDYRASTNPNEDLFKIASDLKPEMIWMGKAERISGEMFGVIKSSFKPTIIKYAADVRAEVLPDALEHNKYVDHFFGTFGGDYLRKHLFPTMKSVCSILTFTDSSFYKKMKVKKEWKADVLWTGRPGFGDNKLRNDIILTLRELKKYDVRMHIDSLSWLGNPEYLWAINGAKIGIGSNSFNKPKYSSDRLGNYMACGTFYLTQRIEGMNECFKEGWDYDCFDTIGEMLEKIDYYIKNDKERRKIAKNGREKILKYFDCYPLVFSMLNTIKNGKPYYPWDDYFEN